MYYRKPAMIPWYYIAFVLITICSTNVGGSCVNENLAVNGECSTSTSIPCRWLFDGAAVGSVSGDIGDWVQYDFGQDVNISVVRMFQYRVRQVEFMFSDDETQLFDLQTDEDGVWIMATFPQITTSSIRITLTNISETATTGSFKQIEFFDTYNENLAIGAECLFQDLRRCTSMVDQDPTRGQSLRSENDSVIVSMQGGPYSICHMRILGKYSLDDNQLSISIGDHTFSHVFPSSDGVNVWNDIAVTPTITESVELFFHWQPASGDAIYEIELYSDDLVPIDETSTESRLSTVILPSTQLPTLPETTMTTPIESRPSTTISSPLPPTQPSSLIVTTFSQISFTPSSSSSSTSSSIIQDGSPIPTATEQLPSNSGNSGKSRKSRKTDNTFLIGVVGASVFGIAIIIGATICITVFLRRRPKATPDHTTQTKNYLPDTNTEDDKSIYDEFSEVIQDMNDGYSVANPDPAQNKVDINQHSLNLAHHNVMGESSSVGIESTYLTPPNQYMTPIDTTNAESPYLRPVAQEKNQYMTPLDTDIIEPPYLKPMASQKRQYTTLVDTRKPHDDYVAPVEINGATDTYYSV